MRLRSRESTPTVAVATTDSMRPIRIVCGGLTFCLTAAEAITLATDIADAVTTYKENDR